MTGHQARATNDVLKDIFREEINVEIDEGVKFGHTKSNLKRWVIKERNYKPHE